MMLSNLSGYYGIPARVSGLLENVRSLAFGAGEQGAIYTPWMIDQHYQDSSETTAVTTVEQPIGSAPDQSGNNYSATQSTDSQRPLLSARKNLFIRTEGFDEATWNKTNATVSANSVAAPDGTTTADLVVATVATDSHRVGQSFAATERPYTISVSARAGGYGWLQIYTGFTTAYANFDLVNGVTGTVSGASTTARITSQGDGWYLCEFTTNLISSTQQIRYAVSDGDFARNAIFAGDGSSGIYLWGAQIEEGSTRTSYQSVNTSTDYDMAGFPIYVHHDGVDDSLLVNLPDLGTDATVSYATVAGGITHLENQTISGDYTLPTVDYVGVVIHESVHTSSQRTAINDLLNAAIAGDLP